MNIRERVIKETENASDIILSEVLEYLQYLKAKHQQRIPETALLSESVRLSPLNSVKCSGRYILHCSWIWIFT